MDSQSGSLWMNNSFSENQNYLSENGVPTMLTWTHGGIEVFVEGSWDNWTSKYLQKQFPDSLICSKFQLIWDQSLVSGMSIPK